MSLPVEAPSGDETLSEKKGYHFALATQIIKMFQQFIQELLELKNGPRF